jgi:GWxTD domain-containing protein
MRKTNKKPFTPLTVLLVPALLAFTLISTLTFCGGASRKLINDLPPVDQLFLSQVRYIIKRAEKKKFLSLATNADRVQFRKEFWKKRDPDPATDDNPFKRQYFERMEEANRIFSEGSAPGWLTDRGRVFILLGPPGEKRVYPTGYRIRDLPSEVWFYGYFPIIFVDRTRSGDYELTSLGSYHIAEILKQHQKGSPKVGSVRNPFAFSLRLFKDKQAGHHNMQIIMPYKNIIFQAKGKGFGADIIVHITLTEAKTKKSQNMDTPHTIIVSPQDLEKLDSNYIFNIPLKLAPGKYEATVVVENKADNINVRDKISFKI